MNSGDQGRPGSGTFLKPARLSVAVDEAVAIGRWSPHHRRSHSFPPCGGESCTRSSPVTTSISPCALTFTPATRSPAATTAFTTLVKSRWRNVEGARATSLFLVVGAVGQGAGALASLNPLSFRRRSRNQRNQRN